MNKFKQFINGCRVLVGNKEFAGGNKNWAIAASLFRQLISIGGVGVVRGQTIKAIEDNFKERIKKNPHITIGELLTPITDTPSFMELLKTLTIDEDALRLFARESLKKWGKNDKGKKR